MANIFSGSEIVQLGIEIEKNGKDFYDVLVRQSKNRKGREVFEYLAGEEEKHIATFQKILDKLEKYQPPESYPGEYFAYMNALAGDYVFTQKNKGKEIAKRITGDKQAVDTGMGFEKDSILFYEGMKKVVPEHHHKVLDELIGQEQKHLRQLCDLKKAL